MISLYTLIFHAIAVVMIVSTVLAVTRKNMVHAVLYLVVSFLGSGLMFFLLGGPLLAVFEVMIYAGAIMVLFLFIVMMLKFEKMPFETGRSRYYLAALATCGLYFFLCVVSSLVLAPEDTAGIPAAMANPGVFGHFLFHRHWLSIEIVSLLLLIALIGVLQLGLGPGRRKAK
jgi:NADH-quinone oxidoreductase subunit J